MKYLLTIALLFILTDSVFAFGVVQFKATVLNFDSEKVTLATSNKDKTGKPSKIVLSRSYLKGKDLRWGKPVFVSMDAKDYEKLVSPQLK